MPGGTPDPRNSVEQVLLRNPPAGTYTAVVRGAAVRLEKQGYALVATGALSETQPLPPPAELTAADDGDGRIRLSWTPVSGAASYQVLRTAEGCGTAGTVVAPASFAARQRRSPAISS